MSAAQIIHWKPNGARRYPQARAAGAASVVRVQSRFTSDAVVFSGFARNRVVNAGAVGTISRASSVNGGG